MEITTVDLNQLNNIVKLVTRDSTKFEVAGDEIGAFLQMNQWLGNLRVRFTEELKVQAEKAKVAAEKAAKDMETNKNKADLLDGLASQAKETTTPIPKSSSKKKTQTPKNKA